VKSGTPAPTRRRFPRYTPTATFPASKPEKMPGVAPHTGEAVHIGLGRLRREVVGQGAPPPLRGGVIDLLHHALAVAAPRRADRHRPRRSVWPPRQRMRSPAPSRGHTPWPSGRIARPGSPHRGRAPPGRGRRPGAADPSTVTERPATCANAPMIRPADALSYPSPTSRVGSANPANPIGFHPQADG
jgi:hypothetical protein